MAKKTNEPNFHKGRISQKCFGKNSSSWKNVETSLYIPARFRVFLWSFLWGCDVVGDVTGGDEWKLRHGLLATAKVGIHIYWVSIIIKIDEAIHTRI